MKTLSRDQAKCAIEKLSDLLKINMCQLYVTRVDFGTNLCTKYAPAVYYKSMGGLSNYLRCEQPNGLLYTSVGTDRSLSFYDKVRQLKRAKEEVPVEFADKNLFRYEIRYLKHVSKNLNIKGGLTADKLFDETVYQMFMSNWTSKYDSIKKEQMLIPQKIDITGKKTLRIAGVLSYINDNGGEASLIQMVKRMQTAHKLTPKQAHDIIDAINEATECGGALVDDNEYISELNRLILETPDKFP